MAGSMNVKKISRSQKLFQASLGVLVLAVLIFAGIKGLTFVKNMELKHVNNRIEKKEEQLKIYESSTGYTKFLAVKSLQEKTAGMSRFYRIEKISEILEDLKNVDDGEGDTTIELSDFYVSLDEVSLRGVVSSLKDLYYTNVSGKMRAVLDRFESLEFIDKMVIKEYNRVDDGFEFSLYANVIDNDGK